MSYGARRRSHSPARGSAPSICGMNTLQSSEGTLAANSIIVSIEPSESAFTRSESLSPPPHAHSEPAPLVRIAANEVLKVDHGSIRVSGDVSWETPISCHRDLLANDKVKPSLIVSDQVNRQDHRAGSER